MWFFGFADLKKFKNPVLVIPPQDPEQNRNLWEIKNWSKGIEIWYAWIRQRVTQCGEEFLASAPS